MKKRIVSICLVCALFISLFALFGGKTNPEKNDFAEKLISIYQKYDGDIKSNSEFALKRLMLSDYKGNNTYSADDYAFDKEHSFAVLQYKSEEAAKKAYKKIKSDGIPVDCDSKAELDSVEKGSVYPLGSNTIGTPSYISKFNMTKEDVVVAVVDTGVMYDHELMADRFVSRGYDFSDDGRSNAYYDIQKRGAYFGHATFVCGIIADNTPDNVKILPYKTVAFGDSEASNSAMVAAIYDAVDKGANVINVSMSATSGANAFKYAVQTALKNNVCICASAGNNSKEIKYRYPAAIEGVITVSAVESDMETFADFSNFGTAVDFCAPGRSVVSACPYKSGEEKYVKNSGTSFSSPYVAAVCADIKSINTSFSKDDVYSIICDFSRDLGASGYDIYCGNGMPDIGNMVYTDSENYAFSIPEGELLVNNSIDYTQSTQPWRLFADRMLSVSIDENVETIGSYAFYNMKKAHFDMPVNFKKIGEYAFYSCALIDEISFDENVVSIGDNAFKGLSDDFCIYGYRNTAAETYALKEKVKFEKLGCKHNYVADVVDPTDEEEGYTVYTCAVCGDSYIGDYIQPPEYYEGECGMGVSWRYLTKEKILEINGTGYMNAYTSELDVPWHMFMSKIKEVVISENISFISDYILYNAQNAEKLTIYSKSAEINDKTVVFDTESKLRIYVYDDSSAKDYLSDKGIEYISLGCAHSRYIDFREEQPSCCYDTYEIYTCKDCNYEYREYVSNENKGHYFSGTLNTLNHNAIENADVYIDGKLSAKTNEKGKFIVYPVLCANHNVEIKLGNRVIYEFEINPNRSNIRSDVEYCFGDYDNNGYINAKDYSFALKNGFDKSDILDFGKTAENSISFEKYDNQELPFAIRVYNEPNDDTDYMRDFIGIIENNSEYVIKECGFIYGKNMSDDVLYLDRVGYVNDEGLVVKKRSTTDSTKYEKVLTYGSKSKEGVLSARFFIIYTNGVTDCTCYSDVTTYEY
ncbi:MAG: S8 family serine peptidase [Eubacterium sp.]|nr:S8 family serine peptidase [Eubacterium sp.]